MTPRTTLPAGSLLARIHFTTGPHPAAWNTWRTHGPLAIGRFDPHPLPITNHRVHGVIYASLADAQFDPMTHCLAEVFQRDRTIALHRGTPTFTLFEISREVSLLDLRAQHASSEGRSTTHVWARDAYRDTPPADGVLYPTGLAARPGVDAAMTSVCLWKRRRSCLPPQPIFSRPLADASLRGAVELAATQLNYLLLV